MIQSHSGATAEQVQEVDGTVENLLTLVIALTLFIIGAPAWKRLTAMIWAGCCRRVEKTQAGEREGDRDNISGSPEANTPSPDQASILPNLVNLFHSFLELLRPDTARSAPVDRDSGTQDPNFPDDLKNWLAPPSSTPPTPNYHFVHPITSTPYTPPKYFQYPPNPPLSVRVV